jgi:hypothetical protein
MLDKKKLQSITNNILHVMDWQDLLLLVLLGWATVPLLSVPYWTSMATVDVEEDDYAIAVEISKPRLPQSTAVIELPTMCHRLPSWRF